MFSICNVLCLWFVLSSFCLSRVSYGTKFYTHHSCTPMKLKDLCMSRNVESFKKINFFILKTLSCALKHYLPECRENGVLFSLAILCFHFANPPLLYLAIFTFKSKYLFFTLFPTFSSVDLIFKYCTSSVQIGAITNPRQT